MRRTGSCVACRPRHWSAGITIWIGAVAVAAAALGLQVAQGANATVAAAPVGDAAGGQALTAAGGVVEAVTAYWPGWRGPRGDGIDAGFRAPDAWPGTLQKRWGVAVGKGHASPVADGEQVFVHTRRGNEEVVAAYRLGTGSVDWSRSFRVDFRPEAEAGSHSNHPKATPATADGRLFTLSINGVLSAWATDDGELLWRVGAGDRSRRGTSGHAAVPSGAPLWGASSSPLVDGEHVIAHLGSDGSGALVAIAAATGEVVWTVGDAGPSYASPILAEIGAIRQIVTQTEDALIGVEPASGKVLWRYPFQQTFWQQNTVTPAVVGDIIVISGESRPLLGIEPRLIDGQWTVVERWKNRRYSLNLTSPVRHRGFVYALSSRDRGRVFCLDPLSGEVLWQGPARTGEYASVVSTPENLFVLTSNADLLVIEPGSESLEVVASYEVADSPTWAHPLLLEGGVLIKSVDTLSLWTWR